LHDAGIVHGDIKPHNIHFSRVEDDVVKLIDFGTSRRVNENQEMHRIVGTTFFMSPEVIEHKYHDKCDVWSVGVILYMLISGGPPFDGKTDQELVEAILKGQFDLGGPTGDKQSIWKYASPELKDLIS